MCNVHGYEAIGYLDECERPVLFDKRSDEEKRRRTLSYCHAGGLTVIYKSLRPRTCVGSMAGGHVGGGLRCERGCRTARECKAKDD